MSYISKIRECILTNSLDGFVLFHRDAFGNSIINESFNIISKITGFTGSYAVLYVTLDKIVIYTDARYEYRIKGELSIDIDVKLTNFLKDVSDKKVGFDPYFSTNADIRGIKSAIPIQGIFYDFFNDMLSVNFNVFDDKYGDEKKNKVLKFVDRLKSEGADWYIGTSETLSWITNKRSDFIKYYPIVLGYVLISKNGDVIELECNEKIYDNLREKIKSLSNQKILFDKSIFPVVVEDMLCGSNVSIIDKKDIGFEVKSLKSESEIENMKMANIKDSVMFMRLLFFLRNNTEQITENDIVYYIRNLKIEDPDFFDESFESIVASDENSACIHYSSRRNNKLIKDLLLIDTGSQYFCGTTDFTRVIMMNNRAITDFYKFIYTSVLKSHIALANCIFPEKTVGKELNAICRANLWGNSLDFKHGTGHGIGQFLNVHEPGISISNKSDIEILPGMIISNEPGLYMEGQFGVRLENAILCKSLSNGFLGFETISYMPFERILINLDMLTDAEKMWLNNYYREGKTVISEHVTNQELVKFIENEFKEF